MEVLQIVLCAVSKGYIFGINLNLSCFINTPGVSIRIYLEVSCYVPHIVGPIRSWKADCEVEARFIKWETACLVYFVLFNNLLVTGTSSGVEDDCLFLRVVQN